MVNTAHAPLPIDIGPTELADAILSAAIGIEADRVWIDPTYLGGDYTISFERRGAKLATASMSTGMATATISRLAMIAEVDLTASRAIGTARICRAEREYELTVALRQLPEPRAELMLDTHTARDVDPNRDLQPGDCVDHYRVVARLGAGGMGQVYRVDHWTLGRAYALKVLQREAVERDPRSIQRFVREARAASRIRHPNIIDVFDFGYLNDGRPYFVMEVMRGASLGEQIDATGAIPPSIAFAIAAQVAAALAAAHDVGVIHADVTPSNIMFDSDDSSRVKLVDFGLAELRDDRRAAVTTGFFMGTPRYVSPEQLHGDKATEASDQYAFGIVLYEMLAGTPPFCHPSLPRLCMQHVSAPVPPVRSPFVELPPEVDALLARCLAKAPLRRFNDMHAVVAELAAVTALVARAALGTGVTP